MTSRGSFGSGTPIGPATGDLTGSYPGPAVTSTSLAAPLPVIQGGTGSASQNFVDLTQNQNIAGAKVFTDRLVVPTPVSGIDAVSKSYADGISAGVSVKASVAAATAGVALPANTYANGTSGVGATLTATTPGVLVIDGYTVLLNDRVMVKDEATASHNGIYTVTTLGTVSVAYVLTRATDMNTPTSIPAAEALITGGTLNKGSSWIVIGGGPYTLGTTAITFTQFTSPGLVNVGLGLRQTGNTISLEIPVDPSNLPAATTSTTGTIELAGDLSGTNVLPTVVNTHLASPLPLAQGGTAATTASAARTNLGLGSAAVDNVNTTAGNIAPLGTQAAGAVGQVADAGHVHAMPTLDQVNAPVANVSMNSNKITGLANGTLSTDGATFGQIPTTLPPSGSAGGDLTGTYPNPTLSATTNVNNIVRANRLDQMTAPTGSVSMNTQKITNLSNGALSSDAAAFGQIPTTLPPTGSATGDLSGTYPAPTVAKVNGIAASGTPAYGQVLAATSSSAASWQIMPGFMASTGVLTGGTMSINGGNPAAFDIVQTVGYIADYTTSPSNPTITKVTIPAQTVAITGINATRGTNWWAADATGTITSVGPNPLSATQRRTMIQLGATASVVGTGVIVAIAGVPIQLTQSLNQYIDLINSLGPFSISGNMISPNGANLAFNKSVGTGFFPDFNSASNPNNPHIVTNAAETTATFRYATQLSGSTSGSFVTAIDPGHYDVGGVITAVPGGTNTSTIQKVFLFGTGGPPYQLVVQYGQTTFPSLSAAVSAIGTTNYIIDPDFVGVGTLIGWIVLSKGATDLSNTSQAMFIQAAKFARP